MRYLDVRLPIRTLLADHQVAARQGLEALFSTFEDMEVVAIAKNGREVVEMADRLQPDLIVLDGRMPVLSGIEATRQIKTRYPRIAVVMHSFYPWLEDDARSAGVDSFLLKGCSPEVLMAAARRAVGRCQTEMESGQLLVGEND